MSIEVATPKDLSPKEKGDLFESLIAEFLRTQSYQVTEQVRVTAAELDLLCTHQISKKLIYVECKAHRDPLSSNVLTNLLGTQTLKGYDEAWLISTGPLGKDAKGFQVEWESKPPSESKQLLIFTPKRILDALVDSSIIRPTPQEAALQLVKTVDRLGDWVLLITPFGRFWGVSILVGGIPAGVVLFSAKSGALISESALLMNVSNTDTSLLGLDFNYVFKLQEETIDLDELNEYPQVVEVKHAEYWSDYRPSRPEDFVGRIETQNRIIQFFEGVKGKDTPTRVFALKGDSGMGKSSLIAKLRYRFGNRRYRKTYFLFAVDVRAASGPTYVLLSLLSCLRAAQQAGFGESNGPELSISNSSQPLNSPSIQQYLATLESKSQVVCLVLDQFEELYAKSEMFSIFDVAERLMISTSSVQSNFIMGFAWRTDTSVQQDHPAYYLWHKLADHRLEMNLSRFDHAEASQAITIFQKELGEQLRPDIRKYLLESSQGYPWLLKKLCIHLYEQVQQGISQSELLDKALDVKSLFDRDLQLLNPAENACLKLIAENAPIDWYEVLDNFGQEVLHGLQDKRMIIRSGDKLNLYWDIFREYVLAGSIPSIPLSYLPTSPSITSMLRIASYLDHSEPRSSSELGHQTGLSEKTVGNVVRDLLMFGAASGTHSQILLDPAVESSDPTNVLKRLRNVIQRHALTLRFADLPDGTRLTLDDIAGILKQINPAAQSRERTWKIYAQRMGDWLSATGYILPEETGWLIQDQGEINPQFRRPIRKERIFIGDTSPERTIEALDLIKEKGPQRWQDFCDKGLRNAAMVLRQLGLIEHHQRRYHITQSAEEVSSRIAVMNAARTQKSIIKVILLLQGSPKSSGKQVGKYINSEFQRNWSDTSETRTGNSLRRWGEWIISMSQLKENRGQC